MPKKLSMLCKIPLLLKTYYVGKHNISKIDGLLYCQLMILSNPLSKKLKVLEKWIKPISSMPVITGINSDNGELEHLNNILMKQISEFHSLQEDLVLPKMFLFQILVSILMFCQLFLNWLQDLSHLMLMDTVLPHS